MSEFERWEGRFSAPGYVFGTEPNAFLKSQAHVLKAGQNALTLADGEGRNGVWLAEQGLDVLAVDFSPTALKKSRKLAAERGVTLRTEQADLATWTWPREEFDVVVGIFFQFATPAQRPRFFAGIKQALRPGGLLLMQNYRAEQLQYRTGGPSDIERLYTRALLQQAFGDFSALDIKEYDAVMSEGSGHAGMSALIDLVGRK
jgi:cyclopropane fatty-acyl-phospholipid synthase-like methyltransferase